MKRNFGGAVPFNAHQNSSNNPSGVPRKDDKVFSKKGILVFIAVVAAAVVIGILCSIFFGPH